MKKIFLSTLLLFRLISPSAQTPELSAEAWKADIQYLTAQLPKIHPNPFHQLSAVDFNARANALIAEAGKKQDREMTVGLMALLAGLGDGNTRLDWESLDFSYYPLQFQFFDQQLRLVAADSLYRRWLGLHVLKVNQYFLDGAQEKILALIPAHESPNHTRYLMERYFRTPEILDAAGLLDERYSVIMFENEEGTRLKAPLLSKEEEPKNWFKIQEERPAHLVPPFDAVVSGLWVNRLTRNKMAFLYAGDYPTDKKEWKAAYQQVKNKFKEHPSSDVLIDLRENESSNYRAGKKLVKLAAKSAGVKKGGRLYVAIGRQTYAAATLDALLAREKYSAILLGEATGASPNGYRVDEIITLPNSGIRVFVPTKEFKTAEETTGGLSPDHEIPMDWESYQRGIDPVLEWVLRQ